MTGFPVALALSLKELSTVTNQVQKPQEKSPDEHSDRKTEITEKSPPASTCRGTIDNSDLDKVMEEGDPGSVEGGTKQHLKPRLRGGGRSRKAATAAVLMTLNWTVQLVRIQEMILIVMGAKEVMKTLQ